MCSIIRDYRKKIAAPIIVKRLKRIEYSGYDSIEFATESDYPRNLAKSVTME